MKQPISHVENCDNMQFMAQYPDKFFDLALIDPPYGIGFDGQRKSTSKHGGRRAIEYKKWDNKTPDREYFSQLFRVSKNKIIWGANYFPHFLKPSMGWIFWDKGQRISQSDGELAYSSFNRAFRVVEINRNKIQQQGGGFHPTQKPVALYDWLLKNYAKEGDKILDTHMGSQSSRIACYKRGFDYWGCELDKEYFDQGNERFQKAIEMPLFEKQENKGIQTSLL